MCESVQQKLGHTMSIHQNHEATLLVQVAAIFVGSTKNIQIDFQAC